MATKRRKGPPSNETGQEALYLKSLSDRQVNVSVKLRDGEVASLQAIVRDAFEGFVDDAGPDHEARNQESRDGQAHIAPLHLPNPD